MKAIGTYERGKVAADPNDERSEKGLNLGWLGFIGLIKVIRAAVIISGEDWN